MERANFDEESLKQLGEQIKFRTDRLKFEAVRLRSMLAIVKKSYNKCSKIIAFIAGFSGMGQAIMQILEYKQVYIEILPIVLSIVISVFAVWIRFNDYPKRMEKLCIAIETVDSSVKAHLTSQMRNSEDWETLNTSYASALAKATSCGRPEEQDTAGENALKYMKKEHKRQNDFNATMSDPTYGLSKKQIKKRGVTVPDLLMLEDGSLDKRKEMLKNSPQRGRPGVFSRILSSFSNQSTSMSNVGEVDQAKIDKHTDTELMKRDQKIAEQAVVNINAANLELIEKNKKEAAEQRRRDSGR